MPKRLYARSLIIVIAPMILLQSVVAFVFMERHWQMVTQRLSQAVTRDIAAIIDMIETYPHDADYANIIRIAQDRLQLKIDLLPPDPLPPPGPKPFFSILDQILSTEITQQINRPFWIDTVGNSNIVEIRVQLEDKVLRVFVRRSQAYASNTHIFLIWMVGTSLVLLMIAIPFLRNQIRPILTACRSGRKFRQGPADAARFPPARRRGGAPRRLRLHPDARAHRAPDRAAHGDADRRQPRPAHHPHPLQAAAGAGRRRRPRPQALNQDIDDMQSMLEGYLAFARGEASEDAGRFDLEAYFEKLGEEAAAAQAQADDDARRRPRRCMCARTPSPACSPMSSATPSATPSTVDVNATHSRGSLLVIIDDDGPGIPADKREDVFKPFVRLDEARNLDASGTGLGLADRPRHRPQPWRRHHARRQPAGRPARRDPGAGLSRRPNWTRRRVGQKSEKPAAVRHLALDGAEHDGALLVRESRASALRT